MAVRGLQIASVAGDPTYHLACTGEKVVMERVGGLFGQELSHNMLAKMAYNTVFVLSVHRWTRIRGPTVQALQALIQITDERTFNGEHRTREAGM